MEKETSQNRNRRSIWTVSSQGYPGAHFATFPPKLIAPMVLAGTSEKGCCAECEAPWVRIVSKEVVARCAPGKGVRAAAVGELGQQGLRDGHRTLSIRTLGWKPGCNCRCERVKPCVVLDPFMGSGTTAEVSLRNGRWCWGIDLSETYLVGHVIPRVAKMLQSDPDLVYLLNEKDSKIPRASFVAMKPVDL